MGEKVAGIELFGLIVIVLAELFLIYIRYKIIEIFKL